MNQQSTATGPVNGATSAHDLFALTDEQILEIEPVSDGAAVEQPVLADYTQPILVSNARYILMTTQKWHQPLETGEYFLHLKRGNELATSNYAMQESAEGGSQAHSFRKTNFLPEEDWIFSWKSPEPLIASKQGPR